MLADFQTGATASRHVPAAEPAAQDARPAVPDRNDRHGGCRPPAGAAGAVVRGCKLAGDVVYRLDKSAAQRGRQRTPEATLHLIALLGGWPGALLAQALFRHKSSKAAFQLRFWITVVANVAALYWACRQAALMAALHTLLG
ncbi:DUF1294 domain-containing protein [Xanthomonas arboricola]|uniref:DUF1294 domain-containing protein n=1 Tax=Xanthomonas arboricola TaxID=56448 RepID=UPI0021573045|nr:DUF1294 domain-containing protein [Xanthomonas arboricola]